jgi:CheY-like chemotaxis protein
MPQHRILCVDDDADHRELLIAQLHHHSDLAATCASTADEALRKIESEQFSLYILDSRMPGRDGLSLCAQIRALDHDTPIVIYSGRASESDIQAGLQAGATAYHVKPDSAGLIQTVKRLLKTSEAVTAKPAVQ